MPYLVRAKGRPVMIRDLGRKLMVRVGAEPVAFLDLPPGSLRLPGGDKDIEVVPIKDIDGYTMPEPYRKPSPKPKAQAKSEVAAPVAITEEDEHKSRGWRRKKE